MACDKEKSKINALAAWCKDNGYKTNIITRSEIEKMSMIVDINGFDIKTQEKIKALNETYKKNRD